jgi:hypothetical protein
MCARALQGQELTGPRDARRIWGLGAEQRAKVAPTRANFECDFYVSTALSPGARAQRLFPYYEVDSGRPVFAFFLLCFGVPAAITHPARLTQKGTALQLRANFLFIYLNFYISAAVGGLGSTHSLSFFDREHHCI